ncbi:YceI family protein [Rubricoccus marinus]|uniref:YceI family protein n=1 Tax=Rubricoccus marinus TaxID=716817 RepID=UPI001C52FAFA|nr:YceI family protein [Rubricoccus marinus]
MTFSFRALAMGALALGLSACASDTDTAEPLEGATEVVEATAEIPAGTYALDAAHSSLGFSIRHLGVSNVDGSFPEFTGTITVPEQGLGGMSAMVSAQVASISTGNGDRDGHLQSPDFFDAATYPEITFNTTSVTPTGGNSFEMTGDLTMHGVTKSVTLQGEYIGAAMMGETQKIGFEAEGEIDRKDWGLTWAQTNEVGEALVGDTVTLRINAEADMQSGEAATAEVDA